MSAMYKINVFSALLTALSVYMTITVTEETRRRIIKENLHACELLAAEMDIGNIYDFKAARTARDYLEKLSA